MKKIVFSIIGVIAALNLFSNVSGASAFAGFEASFLWDETTYDFGKVPQGTPVSHTFYFTNNGNEPLLISSVKPGCGCTVTEYTQDPIPGGEKGFVKVTYNAAKAGVFQKAVTIGSNAQDPTIIITVKGEVIG